MSMIKRLDVEYRTNGSHYKLFRRSDKAGMYKQYIDGIYVGCEMFKITIKEESEIFGKKLPKREVVPSPNQWGESAWTLSNKLSDEELINRFEKYNKELNECEKMK